ncbi:MAG: YIP1 family protein [Clostridiales bacterium]|nr:YIP1 family protein [Clostridiales bacterium]
MEKLKNFGADLKYAFHVICHPLDGFWDLKHEKRGRAYISVLFLVMYVITSILNKQFNNYTFNEFKVFPEDINIVGTFVTTALVVVIWVAANWGLTTLFDGEGSMKDVFLYTGYSMLPLVLSQIALIPLTNILTVNEATIVTLVTVLGYGWSAILLYTGTMTTHQYSGGKTFIIILAILLGMVIIVFISILFFFLVQEIWNFIYTIYRELELRR